MRLQFGHGPAIHRGSSFQACPQYGQSTMISLIDEGTASSMALAPQGGAMDIPVASASDGGKVDRFRRARLAVREVLYVGAVIRDAVRDDPTERIAKAVRIEPAGLDEIVAAVQAAFELPLVRHADPVAVHAELRVVDGVDDLDLRPVEEVDPAVVHLPHEDLVRARLEPLLHRVDVHHPFPVVDELRHELDELQLQPVPVRDVLDHLRDLGERPLEHDHVQLHRLEAHPKGLLNPFQDGAQGPLPDLLARLRGEGIDRHVDPLEPRGPEGLRALREHRAFCGQGDVGDLPQGPVDNLFHVGADERLPAGELHGTNLELAGDAHDAFDFLGRHLVLVRHPRRYDRPEAFVLAVDTTKVAPFRHADADVRDFAPEGVHEHEYHGNPTGG